VICAAMQTHLKKHYGVESEVQYPATSPNPFGAARGERNGAPLRIVFAGCVYHTVSQSIGLLVRALTGCREKVELHLYTKLSSEDLRILGWDRDNVRSHGWLRQDELQRTLAEADILFLPVSFGGDLYYAKTSFPSKFADYLAAGRPILLVAPADSTASVYARENGFAELVSTASESAVVEGIERIAQSPEYVRRLTARARSAFLLNHDLETQRRQFFARVAALTTATRVFRFERMDGK
jgi:glycosyltransferase involved in cell wall biosynthesis